jgi:hypothetical protein
MGAPAVAGFRRAMAACSYRTRRLSRCSWMACRRSWSRRHRRCSRPARTCPADPAARWRRIRRTVSACRQVGPVGGDGAKVEVAGVKDERHYSVVGGPHQSKTPDLQPPCSVALDVL